MPDLDDPAFSGSDWVVAPTDPSADAKFSFYVKASVTGESAHAWTGALTLVVGCPSDTSPLTITVTPGSYSPNTLTDIQAVAKSVATTYFTIQ